MPAKITSESPIPWGCYEQLRPVQIEHIQSHRPLAFIPWGALEFHSQHNPIGLDGMQAHGQCKALAAAYGGIVLPPVYVATDTIKPFKGFPHSIEHAASTVHTIALEYLHQLTEEGFDRIVIVTGHCGGGHTSTLSDAVDSFNAAAPTSKHQRSARALLIPSFEPIQAEHPSNHAALEETSFQLLFDGDLVDLGALPKDRVATLDEDGVWGTDPRGATAELGQRMLALFTARCEARISSLLKAN